MESLNDKLKSLGVHLGPNHLQQPTPVSQERNRLDFPIEKAVKGTEMDTVFGPVFVACEDYPRDLYENHDLIAPHHLSEILLEWSDHTPTSQDRYIFLDTETSGLAGGTGTFAFLIGLGFYEANAFKLVQIFMRHPEEEIKVLAALNQWTAGTNILVTFNGKSFDVPLINTRHKLHGFSPLFQKDTHTHIDMLPMARKIWKTRLPSRALGDLEREILDINRTDEEVPGWMIPDLYFDYLSNGDARPLARVFYHNAMDIISLALLFTHTNRILENPLTASLDNIDLAAIARIYEGHERYEQAIEMYAAAINQGLPLDIYLQTTLRYAHIYKQKQNWEKAAPLWEKAAAEKSIEAAIELAKYSEHILKDIPLALHWTELALQNSSSRPNGIWSAQLSNAEIKHRLARLQHKKSAE
jgi:uncharacterized protein